MISETFCEFIITNRWTQESRNLRPNVRVLDKGGKHCLSDGCVDADCQIFRCSHQHVIMLSIPLNYLFEANSQQSAPRPPIHSSCDNDFSATFLSEFFEHHREASDSHGKFRRISAIPKRIAGNTRNWGKNSGVLATFGSMDGSAKGRHAGRFGS